MSENLSELELEIKPRRSNSIRESTHWELGGEVVVTLHLLVDKEDNHCDIIMIQSPSAVIELLDFLVRDLPGLGCLCQSWHDQSSGYTLMHMIVSEISSRMVWGKRMTTSNTHAPILGCYGQSQQPPDSPSAPKDHRMQKWWICLLVVDA